MSCPLVKMYGLANYLEFTRSSSDFMFRHEEAGLDFDYGLTMWTWIRFHTQSTGNVTDFFTKWDDGADESFALSKTVGDLINFDVSDDGTTTYSISAALADYEINKWMFVAGRFTSSVEMALFVGKATTGIFNWYRNLVVPVILHPSDVDLMIGGSADGNYLDGDMSHFGLSAECLPNLSDIYIQNMFQQSRPLFL